VFKTGVAGAAWATLIAQGLSCVLSFAVFMRTLGKFKDSEDKDAMDFDDNDVQGVMDENLKTLNSQLPPFCKVSAIEINKEEFQKTAKKSIKRYLYK